MFLWGAATSSHQVEGNNTLNDWWEWEESGRVMEKSGIACDHYNRFKQDFEIAKSLGHTAHRFSLEWSRLQPDEKMWNEGAWEHYREVVKTLRSLEIEPIVTLNHFTLPLWLSRKGGWLCEDSASYFERFAEKAMRHLGKEVTCWITINEPVVYAFCSYIKGRWPPGKSDYKEGIKVVKSLIRSHILAYKTLHESAKRLYSKECIIGIAKNFPLFDAYNKKSFLDKITAFSHNYGYNHFFVRSIRKALDFMGVNYYSRSLVKYRGIRTLRHWSDLGYNVPQAKNVWRNSLGWEVYPDGLYLILKGLSKLRLPIIITENGICTTNDEERSRFIKEHLDSLFKAKGEGSPITGYLYWSLTDNFEWADGYDPRFGLVEINYKTRERTVRPSAHFLTQYIKKKSL